MGKRENLISALGIPYQQDSDTPIRFRISTESPTIAPDPIKPQASLVTASHEYKPSFAENVNRAINSQIAKDVAGSNSAPVEVTFAKKASGVEIILGSHNPEQLTAFSDKLFDAANGALTRPATTVFQRTGPATDHENTHYVTLKAISEQVLLQSVNKALAEDNKLDVNHLIKPSYIAR